MILKNIIEKLNQNNSYKIAFLGDSITSTEWVHPNWREIVEYVVKDKLDESFENWRIPSWGLRFFNFGYDGIHTNELLEKLESDVLPVSPDLVIVMATSNDIFSDITPEQHRQNIYQIIKTLKDRGVEVVYATDICSGNEEYDKRYFPFMNSALSIFEESPGLCPFINMYKELKIFEIDKFFTFISEGNADAKINPGEIDYIHPNVLGNAYIAKIILKKVFEMEFDPKLYINEVALGKMSPNF